MLYTLPYAKYFAKITMFSTATCEINMISIMQVIKWVKKQEDVTTFPAQFSQDVKGNSLWGNHKTSMIIKKYTPKLLYETNQATELFNLCSSCFIGPTEISNHFYSKIIILHISQCL